jgi:hypothetical protein
VSPSCVPPSRVGEYTLTCTGNRQKVDEDDTEDDGVESGDEDADSDDEIDEGQ